MDAKTPFHRVLEIVTPTALARAIGRSQSTVWEWEQRGWAAPDACSEIAAAIDHKVTTEELLKSAAEMKAAVRAARRAGQVAA